MIDWDWRTIELGSYRRDRRRILDPTGRPASRQVYKKARWFLRGARSLAANFSITVDSWLGPEGCPVYVCPICLRALGELALFSGHLTFEHVPPKALGGKELVLTCSQCNTDRGAVIDAHAASRERVRECIADFAGARPRNFGLITLTVGDEKFDADFAIRDGGKHAIRLRGDSLDDQRFRRAFASSGPSNLPPPFVLDLTLGPAYQDTQANLSWLRTAYLARFAVGGYPFIFNPALDVVRRQILRPDQFLLGGRFISAYGNDSLTQKVICNVKKPLVVASPGVKIGPYTVLLPPPGADTTFYARMEQEKPAGQFTADAWAWPKEPSFGMQSESRA